MGAVGEAPWVQTKDDPRVATRLAHIRKASARTAEQATARQARRAVHDKMCGGWNPLPVRAAQPASSQLYS